MGDMQVKPLGNNDGIIGGNNTNAKAIIAAAARVLKCESDDLVDKNGIITYKGARIIIESDKNAHPAVQEFVKHSLNKIAESGAHALIFNDHLQTFEALKELYNK